MGTGVSCIDKDMCEEGAVQLFAELCTQSDVYDMVVRDPAPIFDGVSYVCTMQAHPRIHSSPPAEE